MGKCNHVFTGDKNFPNLALYWSRLPYLISDAISHEATSAAYLNRNSSFLLMRTPILYSIV
jgi:hypothetical protein